MNWPRLAVWIAVDIAVFLIVRAVGSYYFNK